MSVVTKPGLLSGAGLVLLGLAFTGQTARAQAAPPPPVPTHELEGRGECLMCHSGAMEAIKAVPANHAGRENPTCGWCHAKDAEIQTKPPPAPAHELEGRENCLMCHGGAMEAIKAVPASHAGRESKTCGWCHTPATGQ